MSGAALRCSVDFRAVEACWAADADLLGEVGRLGGLAWPGGVRRADRLVLTDR